MFTTHCLLPFATPYSPLPAPHSPLTPPHSLPLPTRLYSLVPTPYPLLPTHDSLLFPCLGVEKSLGGAVRLWHLHDRSRAGWGAAKVLCYPAELHSLIRGDLLVAMTAAISHSNSAWRGRRERVFESSSPAVGPRATTPPLRVIIRIYTYHICMTMHAPCQSALFGP